MQSSLAESVQQQVRPGKCVDLYYPDPQTASKACFRTCVNTRFSQNMTNLSAGTSTFVIPPNNGIQDVVMVFELPALTGGAQDGLGLNRGWGYSLIKSISFRYGGSSQFFLSQQQILQLALKQTPNGFARDDLLALGGAAVNETGLALGPQRAYVWLPLPHCIPTAEGKLPPFPSDLLTQQIIIQCEINSVPSIYSVAPAATGTPAASLSLGEFVVQQVLFDNQGDALARRVDMSTHALSYPVTFTQQEIQIPVAATGASIAASTPISVTLTGFRAGECRSISAWLTYNGDTGSAQIQNPFAWYAPENIVLTYAGERYAVYDRGSGALWNLVNGRLAPQVNDVYLTNNAGVVDITAVPSVDQWVEMPFAQAFDDLTAHSTYTAGKTISNGIVNLQFSIPTLTKQGAAWAGGAQNFVLHISYHYNAVLMLTGGTADYVL
jgi:hypothetical protein